MCSAHISMREKSTGEASRTRGKARGAGGEGEGQRKLVAASDCPRSEISPINRAEVVAIFKQILASTRHSCAAGGQKSARFYGVNTL